MVQNTLIEAEVNGQVFLANHYRKMFEEAMQHSKYMTIWMTPELAAGYLERNLGNRPISEQFVKSYASEITNGRWQYNGEAVIVSREGELLDGQHRLTAIVRSGIAVPVLVVRGIDRATFATLDSGRKRDFAGHLAMHGERNSSTLGAAVNFFMMLESDYTPSHSSRSFKTIADMAAVLEKHPGLRDSVSFVRAHAKEGMIRQGPFACLHYCAMSHHQEKTAHDFWLQLLTGANVSEGSNVWLLRKALIKNMLSTKKYNIVTIMAITIKAFNATITGKRLSSLSWKQGKRGSPDDGKQHRNEPFPEII